MFPRALPVAAACLFGSGLCSLVYQTVWLRAFRLIFGASTPSNAAVLAIFMGGLGLGGILLGRKVEKSSRPLVTYGNLELGVAAGAAVTPFLLDVARTAYVALGGIEGLGFASTFVRLALSALVLGVPVILMGGTLPAAARAVTSRVDTGRRGLSLLYGTSTLGSVAGAVFSTFFLLEVYGARKTLWLACGLNALIGLVARRFGRGLEPVVAPAPPPPTERKSLVFSTRWVLAAAFTTGFVFLIAEHVWYRLAAPLLGGSTYTFGLVLACALLGMGIGGIVYAVAGPKEPTPARFAVTCALEALVLLVPYAAGDTLTQIAFELAGWGRTSFPLLVLSWSVVAAVMVMPAAVVAGYQFPLLLSLKGRAAREVGKDSGEVYAANTLGAIVGSLAGGFTVLPSLTAVGLWRTSAVMLLVLAVVIAVLGRNDHPDSSLRSSSFDRLRLGVVGALGAATIVCLTALGGPTVAWERPADAGPDGLTAASGAVVASGAFDAHDIGAAVVPAALLSSERHEPKSVFVMGPAAVDIAGFLAGVPSVDVVDAAGAAFDLTAQKVRFHVADGRELLAVTDEHYDLILSDPSGPSPARAASFYSQDFYRAVAARLTEDGALSQWVEGSDVEPQALQLVLATMKSVFPQVSAWQLGDRDVLLIATRKPQVWDRDALDALVHAAPYKSAFRNLFGIDRAEGLLALHLASDPTISELAARDDGDVNTDDSPRLEFLFARNAGVPVGDDLRVDLYALAREKRRERPAVKGAVDWAKVEERRAHSFFWRNGVPMGPLS